MTERFKNLDNQILGANPLILIGEAVGLLSPLQLNSYAEKVSDELAKYPCKMLQYKPEQLLKAMLEGRAVTITDLETGRLKGFAQIWEYGINESGQTVQEFGTWLSFEKGVGKLSLAGGIKLASVLYPKDQLIAVVEQDNQIAQGVIQSFGGIEIPGKYSPIIRTVKGEPAWMKRYDITKKGGKSAW